MKGLPPGSNHLTHPEYSVKFTDPSQFRRANTQADAILEVTIPQVDIKPGEGLELGISSELAYVDGQRRTAGASVPVITKARR